MTSKASLLSAYGCIKLLIKWACPCLALKWGGVRGWTLGLLAMHITAMTNAVWVPELSAVVMVYNEMKTIARCLDHLRFCDEIVVIDDMSTDGTWEYLQSRSDVRAVRHLHTTFAAQREYGKDLARGRWILTMDADEYVPSALAETLRRKIREGSGPGQVADGFYLYLKNYYPRTLNGHFWSKHPRLVQKERCHWQQTDNPHSPLLQKGLVFETIAIADGYMEHEPLADLATFMRKKINRNLIVGAQLRAKGGRAQPWKMVLSALGRFWKFYVRKGAFRFGWDGWMMAYAEALEGFTKYAFAYEHPDSARAQPVLSEPGTYPAEAPWVSAPVKNEAALKERAAER